LKELGLSFASENGIWETPSNLLSADYFWETPSNLLSADYFKHSRRNK